MTRTLSRLVLVISFALFLNTPILYAQSEHEVPGDSADVVQARPVEHTDGANSKSESSRSHSTSRSKSQTTARYIKIDTENKVYNNINATNSSTVSIGNTQIGGKDNSRSVSGPSSLNLIVQPNIQSHSDYQYLPDGNWIPPDLARDMLCILGASKARPHYGRYGGCGWVNGRVDFDSTAEQIIADADRYRAKNNGEDPWVDERDHLYYLHDIACRRHGGCTAADNHELAMGLMKLDWVNIEHKTDLALEILTFESLAVGSNLTVDALVIVLEEMIKSNGTPAISDLNSAIAFAALGKAAKYLFAQMDISDNHEILLSQSVDLAIAAATISPTGAAFYAIGEVVKVSTDMIRTNQEISGSYINITNAMAVDMHALKELAQRYESGKSQLSSNELRNLIDHSIQTANNTKQNINSNKWAKYITNRKVTENTSLFIDTYITYLEGLKSKTRA